MEKPKNEKPKSPDTDNPSANKAVSDGRINTQQKEGGQLRHEDSHIDQSGNSAERGETTSGHGQGAGFSRNVH